GTERDVGLHGPWIAGEILLRSELDRIDKDRNDDEPCLPTRGLDQAGMAIVQRPHRGHQTDGQTAPSRPAGGASHLFDRLDDGHFHDVRSIPYDMFDSPSNSSR